MTILKATKIEGYLQLEPCRDLAQAKPGQLAIEGNVGREYRECIVEISKVHKNGMIVIVGGEKYNRRMYESEFRRTGPRGSWQLHSLRPFREGETVESFLSDQEAKRQAKEDEAAAAANAKEAEHKRRLALLGGASLWDNRGEYVYSNFGEVEPIAINVFAWKDALERLHVTHCYIPDPVMDLNGKPGYYIRIWDVVGGNGQTGASSAQGEDPRDTIERWITREWA